MEQRRCRLSPGFLCWPPTPRCAEGCCCTIYRGKAWPGWSCSGRWSQGRSYRHRKWWWHQGTAACQGQAGHRLHKAGSRRRKMACLMTADQAIKHLILLQHGELHPGQNVLISNALYWNVRCRSQIKLCVEPWALALWSSQSMPCFSGRIREEINPGYFRLELALTATSHCKEEMSQTQAMTYNMYSL